VKRSIAFSLTTACMIAALIGISAVSRAAPDDDSSADGILRRSCQNLSAQKAFRVTAEISYEEVLGSGEKVVFGGSLDASLSRPDRLRAEYRDDGQHSGIWYDGKTLTLHDWRANLYAVTEAPPDIDSLLDHTAESLGFTVPVADFYYSDPYQVLMENVESLSHSGREEVGGRSCHRLTLRQEDIDWEIWIEEGDSSLPRKFRITYKKLAGSPRYTVLFTDWDFLRPPGNADFSFDPPAGAERIEFLSSKEGVGPNGEEGQ
jgi:hypothetical protein